MSPTQDKNSPPTACCLKASAHTASAWDALTPDEMDTFNRHAVCKSYRAGETVFMQDDPCKGLYMLQEGLVAVRKIDQEGQSSIVRLAYQGDTLGYRPLLADENHRATAEVIEDARTCFIDAQTMRDLLLHNPQLGMRFLEHTARALGETEERLSQMATLSVRTRIIHLLIILGDRYGMTTDRGAVFFKLPMSQRDLAEVVGARPESVSRALRDIQNDGLLHLSGRSVSINESKRLIDELHHNLSH